MSKIVFFCGDHIEVGKLKKPNPQMYLLAARHYGISPASTVVIEDSFVGLQAAKNANMLCVVTPSFYTNGEDFSMADLVVKDLESAGVKFETIKQQVLQL